MYQYFDRNLSKWNIKDFLKECDSKITRVKLSLYIKCLEKIVNTEEGSRHKKTLELLKNYRERAKDLPSSSSFKPSKLSHEVSIGIQGDKVDRKLVKGWILNCESEKTPSINIQNTFTGNIDDSIIQGIFFSQELQEIEETNVKKDLNLSSKLYENLVCFCNKIGFKTLSKILNIDIAQGMKLEFGGSEAGKYYERQGTTK
ncbi:hypothetical protein Glove_330g90 [Diversispora epigaea]|uniref:Uncharacterized protein n=1 Tax=Diversispora epigaea TaxID=1348612 RepID=A0A397HMX1_9GLOM|nr:hypothetical protein Glove_330g90 [Diversispora epigaea]